MESIFRVGEHLCYAASCFGRLNLGKAYLAVSLTQAGILAYRKENPESFQTIERMKALMMGLNLVGTFWAAGKLLNTLSDKYHISFFSERIKTGNWTAPDWTNRKIFLFNFFAPFVPAGALALPLILTPQDDNATEGENISRLFLTAQMILTLCSSLSLQGGLTAMGHGAALYSTIRTPWTERTCRIPHLNFEQDGANHPIDNLKLRYRGIGDPQAVFDAFHRAANYEHRNEKYHLKIDEAVILSHGHLSLRGAHLDPKLEQADLFKDALLTSAVVQLALILLQRIYPNHAPSLYHLQGFLGSMSPLFFLASGLAGSDFDVTMLVLLPLVALALTYRHLTQQNAALKEQLILEKDLSKLTLTWGASPFQRIFFQGPLITTLCISLYRPLAKDKDDPFFCLAMAVITAATLFYSSQVSWMHLRRTTPNPLMDRSIKFFDSSMREMGTKTTEIFETSIREITTERWIMIPNKEALFPNSEAIHAAMESFFEYTERLFDESYWRNYWHSGRLQLVSQIKEAPWMINGIDISECIFPTTGRLFHKGYGWVPLHPLSTR